MAFDTGLNPGDSVDNEQLCSIFQCSGQGGMRRSHQTNTLVLVSNHIKSIYEDRWDEQGVMHYTGMGAEGDQSLDFMQNKTLAESRTNGVAVFLFEVFTPKAYTYIGPVELADKPYQSQQTDQKGKLRHVWLFPLKQLILGDLPAFSATVIQAHEDRKSKSARKLSDQALAEQAQRVPNRPGIMTVQSAQYLRSPYVAEYARRRAKGICQLCSQSAPFQDNNGEPFLENHHIIWLSRGGTDTITNTVALCPNCHRRMHILDRAEDKERLSKLVADI
jgi:5-methylcytosine-specific restriction protein A